MSAENKPGLKEISQAGDVIVTGGALIGYQIGLITAATASTAIGLSILTFIGAEYAGRFFRGEKK